AADQSVVLHGEFAGKTLSELVQRQNLPLFGRHAGRTQFPLLVKFLDASDVLSVQVHPDDQLAKEFDPTENGKTEAWVIVDAAPGSELFVGFRRGVTEDELRAALRNGTVASLLHRIPVKAGDCVYVPAGTVHAIGAGVLLAEIQQYSDLTFRLFDWGRVGSDGRPRELHIESALRCIDFHRGPVEPIEPTPLESDHQLEELVRSPHFVLRRHRALEEFSMPQDDRFHVLLSLSGSGRLNCGADRIEMPRGQSVLLPAARPDVVINPSGGMITLLDASLP
ncbi:MAG: type I phosphomannose isomerase catalytic subunit, partial [Planctomycetaceae bacterium]